MKPRLLDLFCGAGGATVGYARAGFEITGVDCRPMPRFPYRFIQANALEYLAEHGREYDVIHASPPCQRFSIGSIAGRSRDRHPDLLTPTRTALLANGRPWVIENVPGAPMQPPTIMLCGLMFGLKVFRHRLFESSELLFAPSHPSHRGKRIGEGGMCCVAGHGGQSSGFGQGWSRRVPADHRTKAAWSRAMGIDWMTRDELAQAIPPLYTLWIGRQLINALGATVFLLSGAQ